MKLPLPKRAKTAPSEVTIDASEHAMYQIKGGKITQAFKLSGRSKFILDIGDEGAILTYYKSGSVENRWFASDPSSENLEVFGKALATDFGAPILITLDTIDQTYSQQTLPPVSKMNLGGLLKRRIRREFGDTPLKGSYPLGRTETKEWNFMLFAIEQNEVTQKWIEWVLSQGNRPLGIRVMPLEMTSLATVLYKLYRSQQNILDTDACEWKFIVSHNKISGFRQVIVKDDYLVFTRLGQPLEGGPDVQAGMIEQEIASTLEYLKRIGLKSLDDLHLHVIAAQDIVNIIDVSKLGVRSKMLISPYQAALQLGWEKVSQPDDKFADIFLSIFAMVNKKSIAKLWTQPLDKIRKLYMIKPALRLAGLAIAVISLGYAGVSMYSWWDQSEKIETSKNQSDVIVKDIESLKAAVNMPPEELEKVLDLFDLYHQLQKQKLNPTNFMNHLSQAFANLPEDMLVQEVNWTEGDTTDSANAAMPDPAMLDPAMAPPGGEMPQAAGTAPVAPPTGTPMKVKGLLNINIAVPSNIKSEALQTRAQGVITKIQEAVPFYAFKLKEIPGANSANDAISIDLNAPVEPGDKLSAITLKTEFTGTEYIPDTRSGTQP